MAIKINNNSYSGFFLNGEAINTIYLNGNQVFGNGGSEPTPTPAWDDDFLTIEALNPSTTVQLKNPSNKNIWYRKDNQTEYTKIPTGDTSITIENANGYIKLYGDNEGVGSAQDSTAFNIYCQMNCNCYGKVTSLLSSGCSQTISSTYTFSYLFKQSLIVNASGLILPNNVTGNCYSSMFEGCSSLTQAPQLPAKTLKSSCYSNMFMLCTSLTSAPQLLATTLEDFCYYNMFTGCGKLSTVTLYYADAAPTDDSYFYNWLEYAGGTGCTIYAPANALWNSTDSTMYVPSNWTVEKVVYSESDITINNETPSTAITYGNTFNLNASTTPTGATLSYSSSDTSIATVDNSGVVTAVGKGNATITITAQGFDDDVNKVHYNTTSKTVSVECAYQPQQIVITNSTPSEAINPNDTFDLNASTTPTGITLTYSSSDTSVATVNSNGVITVVTTGTTIITISAQGFDDDVNHITYTSASTTIRLTDGEVSFNPLIDSGYFVIKSIANNPTIIVYTHPRGMSGTISYRKNGEGDWTTIPSSGTTNISTQTDDYIEFKGDAMISGTVQQGLFNTDLDDSIEVGGWLMALNKNGEINSSNNRIDGAKLKALFRNCNGTVSAQYLKFPTDTTDRCYTQMFYKNEHLITPPSVLPATEVADYAYSEMFNGCTNLATAPVISAKTLATYGFNRMFYGCTSLTTVSLLSPRTFDVYACRQMFMNCTNLTSLSMGFSEYDSSIRAFNQMLRNVTTTGTFYCPSNATYSASDLGLPSTWTLSKTL